MSAPKARSDSRLRLRYEIIGVVLLLVLGAIPALWIWYKQAVEKREALNQTLDPERVNLLKSESLDQSLRRLGSDGMAYLRPGVKMNNALGLVEMPLGPESDREMERHVLIILSNRRFVKVLQQLLSMSKEEVSAIVNRELEQALSLYEPLIARPLTVIRKDSGFARPTAFGIVFEDNVDAPPFLAGQRLRLLALLLIASKLELTDCRASVIKVAQKAVSDYVLVSNKHEFDEHVAAMLMLEESIYNRQVLATALVGTCKSPAVDAVVQRHKLSWKSLDLAAYDALATPFDAMRWGVTTDYSKGRISIKYVSALTDEALKELLDAASADEGPRSKPGL